MKRRVPHGPAHAKYSASGSYRWMNCPGSIALSANAPEQVESIYAKEGTDAHACLEFLLKNSRTPKMLHAASEYLRKKYPVEMVDLAQTTADYIRSKHSGLDAELLCETRVDSSSFTCKGQFGTVDAAIVEPFGKLTVIDYKYGAGLVVNPEGPDGRGNSQLVYYALGLSAQYHHNFEEVELVVIQPRAYHEDGAVRSFKMSIDELLAWVPRFQEAVDKCAEADHWPGEEFIEDYLHAGAWCKFCPAAVICPEIKNEALNRAKIAFSPLGEIESTPEPRMIKGPDLSIALDACDQLETWISKVRAHAFQVLERGGKIKGYKLVDKRPQRKWADEARAEADAWKLIGEKAFTEVKLLTPAQIEKIQDDFIDKSELEAFVRKRTVKESSGRTIAKESDQRLSVNPIESVFSVIDVD